MDTIFISAPNVDPHFDGLLAASETEKQHISDSEQVFKVINDNNLKILLSNVFLDILNF